MGGPPLKDYKMTDTTEKGHTIERGHARNVINALLLLAVRCRSGEVQLGIKAMAEALGHDILNGTLFITQQSSVMSPYIRRIDIDKSAEALKMLKCTGEFVEGVEIVQIALGQSDTLSTLRQ